MAIDSFYDELILVRRWLDDGYGSYGGCGGHDYQFKLFLLDCGFGG